MRTNPCRFIVLVFLFVFLAFLTSCAGGAGGGQPVSVAIWELNALGPMDATQTAMGELMSAQITSHFEASRNYLPIERSRLLKVMEELNIGTSDLADNRTRLRLGRLIGAQQMVFGAYQIVVGTMRLDIRLVDVASGRILKVGVGTVAGDLPAEWMGAADEAAAEILR